MLGTSNGFSDRPDLFTPNIEFGGYRGESLPKRLRLISQDVDLVESRNNVPACSPIDPGVLFAFVPTRTRTRTMFSSREMTITPNDQRTYTSATGYCIVLTRGMQITSVCCQISLNSMTLKSSGIGCTSKHVSLYFFHVLCTWDLTFVPCLFITGTCDCNCTWVHCLVL